MRVWFRFERLVVRALVTLCVGWVFAAAVLAQPGGCYKGTWQSESCREKREKLVAEYKSRIDELTTRIASEPRNADNYFQRGMVYATMIFGPGLGATTVEFDAVVYFEDIEKNAIENISAAIEISPKAQYFTERGRLSEELWRRQLDQRSPFVISDPRARTDERLSEIESLYFENENFRSADDDYSKAVAASGRDEQAREDAETRFVMLRYTRAVRLGINVVIPAVLAGTRFADTMMSDLDRYVEHVKAQTSKYKSNPSGNRSALTQQAEVAVNLGKDDEALRSLSEAARLVEPDDGYFCKTYSLRAKVYARNRNLDGAIKDLTTAVEKDQSCKWLFETRGDLYKKKGDFRKAAEDYTKVVNEKDPFLTLIQLWKRGKMYLEVGDAEKALADFTRGIGRVSSCEEDFLLRAQAFRRLGDEAAAKDDSKRAEKLAQRPQVERESSCGHHHLLDW